MSKDIKYETAYAELQAIVHKMESVEQLLRLWTRLVAKGITLACVEVVDI